jgi:hypothetical protein
MTGSGADDGSDDSDAQSTPSANIGGQPGMGDAAQVADT